MLRLTLLLYYVVAVLCEGGYYSHCSHVCHCSVLLHSSD